MVVSGVASVQPIQIIGLVGKVDSMQGGLQVGKPIGFADVVWKWIFDIFIELIQCGRDQAPELAAGDSGGFFVDRNDSSDVERRQLSFINYFVFRIEKNKS